MTYNFTLQHKPKRLTVWYIRNLLLLVKVLLILIVMLKLAVELEEVARKELEKEFKKVEIRIEKGTRRNRKLRNEIRKEQNNKWKELASNYSSKVDFLVRNYNKKKKSKESRDNDDILIEGVKVTDEELDLSNEEKPEVPIYGDDVELDEDEQAILRKHPKFAV